MTHGVAQLDHPTGKPTAGNSYHTLRVDHQLLDHSLTFELKTKGHQAEKGLPQR